MTEWSEMKTAMRQRMADQANQLIQSKRQARNTLTPIGQSMRKDVTPESIRVTPNIFQSMNGKATREEALTICEKCGDREKQFVIEPKKCVYQMQVLGYVPQKCTCQRAEEQKEQEKQGRLVVWKHQQEMLRARCAKCYTWLGWAWDTSPLQSKTFENFNEGWQDKGLLVASEFAESDENGMLTQKGNLILWSDVSWGTGKTHLTAAICNALITKNIPCLFAKASNLFDALGARMGDKHSYRESFEQIIMMACETPLLVLDDMNKLYIPEKDRANSEENYKVKKIFDIFDYRYQRHLPTIITTNASVQITANGDILGISAYIGRAATSRLFENGLQIVNMNGDDYRMYLGGKK